jgi:3-hydroxyisobutyrate dehydrogenase
MPFTISNGAKDLAYYQKAAESAGVAHTIAQGIAETLNAVVEDGHGQRYMPELVSVLKAK